MARSEDTMGPEAILSFAHDLFTLRERDNGKKGYGCTLLYEKSVDLTPLHNLAFAACELEWPGKAAQWIKDGLIKTPFLDGDGKQALSKKTGERHPGYAGRTFIRCTSGEDFKPKVFGRKGKEQPIFSAEDCPSGSRVKPVVNAYTWDNATNGKGVSFGISLVQVVKAATGDEVLGGGGGPDPDKFLTVIADEGDAPAATKTGAGAGGLFG